jgi:RNA polymerase sigma-70 factor, ECF subfamily
MSVSMAETDAAPDVPAHTRALSFAQLYEEQRLAVYRYLRGWTRSDEDALDLTSQTFERALRHFGRFQAREGGARAWLLRIARNAAIDAHRRRHGATQLDADLHALDRMAMDQDRQAREKSEVLDLLARLPADQRDAVLLRYAAGLSAREIGMVLGKREAAVQKQIGRALVTLREALR